MTFYKPYKFINSSIIAKALEENDYEFSALESACLIHQSTKTTLKEKQEAWNEMIETVPNETIKIANRKTPLHDYLRNLINLQNELLKEFYNRTRDYEYEEAALRFFGNKKPGKYELEYIYTDRSVTHTYAPKVSFSDYNSCVEYINNDKEKEHYKSGVLVRYRISGVYKGETIITIVNREFEVVQIEYWGSGLSEQNAKTQQIDYLSRFIIRVEDNIAL